MKPFAWFLALFLSVSIINYPNPFNPKAGELATFECSSDATMEAALYIFDLSARLVAQKDFSLTPGTTARPAWNGYSNQNELVGNGIYLYRLVNPATRQSAAKGKIWVINR